MFLAAATVLAFSWSSARGDDLNQPPYRGDPLSVYAHWNLLAGTTFLDLTQWSSVDDTDPSTTLYPNFTPTPQVQPNGGIYQFQLPNWVDNMPVKYLRLQLTWTGTTQPPINLFSEGLDGVNLITAAVTFASIPVVQPNGVYQYFDLEFHPNLDFERVHVELPANNYLTQTVIDTVSTVPEPATLTVLALGMASSLIRRNKKA